MKKYFALLVFVGGITFSSALTCTDLPKNLSKGSEDSNVLKLQQFLFDSGYLTANPNGYFGIGTAQAVKKFQKVNGLSQVGSVGSGTRAKIKSVSCKQIVKNTSSLISKTNEISNSKNILNKGAIGSSCLNSNNLKDCFVDDFINCNVSEFSTTTDINSQGSKINYSVYYKISLDSNQKCSTKAVIKTSLNTGTVLKNSSLEKNCLASSKFLKNFKDSSSRLDKGSVYSMIANENITELLYKYIFGNVSKTETQLNLDKINKQKLDPTQDFSCSTSFEIN